MKTSEQKEPKVVAHFRLRVNNTPVCENLVSIN